MDVSQASRPLDAAPDPRSGGHRASCPRCGARVVRVSRRTLDMLLNVIVPVHRYRCPHPSCRWGGLMRSRGARLPYGESGEAPRCTLEASDL